MLLKTLHQICHPDIAIDLGTSTTRVAVGHRGYRFSAPSLAGTVPALAKGVIVNVDAATETLRPALYHLRRYGVPRPRAIACAPTDATPEEREAIRTACFGAGATSVLLMPEPLAAALGDGVDYRSRIPALIMDIGEGVTDCAVIREGRLAGTFASRVACADLNAAIRAAVAHFSGVPIRGTDAMRLVYEIGASPLELNSDGMPDLRFVTITDRLLGEDTRIPAGMLQESIEPVIDRIVETLHCLLIDQPTLRTELLLSDSQVHLSGGGALIPGLANRIASSTGLPVRVVRNPLNGLVQGAKRVLPIADQYDLWRRAGQSY